MADNADYVTGRVREPETLADLTRGNMPKGPAGDWLRAILDETQTRNRARAGRVRKYPDLVEALRTEADVRDPATWNGYIPPEWVNVGESEILHDQDGFAHPDHERASAAQRNDSPVRVALQAITDEANRREREAGIEVDDPTSAEIVSRHRFPFPGLRADPDRQAVRENRQQRRARERRGGKRGKP